MATYQFTANSTGSTPSVALTSTKVKVVSNAACYFAVGTSPIAYTTGNCVLLPANTIRDIIVGEGSYTSQWTQVGNVVTSVTNPRITFITTAGTLAVVNITEIGTVDFSRTAD